MGKNCYNDNSSSTSGANSYSQRRKRMDRKVSLSEKAGEALRNELKKRNLTQEEFAEMLNVDIRTISRYITLGINKLATLELICERLDINVKDFLFNN